jgi:hypothetical protein
MFKRRDPDDPRSPLTPGARTAVVLSATAAAPFVYTIVYLGIVFFDPIFVYIAGGVVSFAAIAAVIQLQLRGPRDWYLRGAAWGLLLLVLFTSYFAVFVSVTMSSEVGDF